MRLEVFNTSGSERWDEFIYNSANGTLFHTWAWLETIEKYLNYRLIPLVFFDSDDDMPFGVIPLFYKKIFGIKMFFSPPPRSSITLGPALLNKGYRQHKFELAYMDFQKQIDIFIEQSGANYTSIVTSTGLLDVRPFTWAGYQVSPLYTYKIDLTKGEENIWRDISEQIRKSVKRAGKNNISIRKVDAIKEIDYIFDSVKKRYASKHIEVSGEDEYIRGLIEQFGATSIEAWMAFGDEKPVGARVCTVYKDTVTAWIGGFRSESDNLGGNELLNWTTILNAMHGGYHWLELMGANTRHLCNYKARYCPELFIYFQIKKTDWLGNLAERMYLLMKRKKL